MQWIPRAVQVVGVILFGLVGLYGSAEAGAGRFSLPFGIIGVLGWAGLYLAWGFRRVEENRYVVWERLGKLSHVSRSGPTIACLPPFIDRPAADGGDGDFLYHDIKIAPGGEEGDIDFKGGGTGKPVGEVNYRVIDRNDIFLSEDIKYADGACLYAYTVGDTRDLILRIILGALRQKLQKQTVEEASGNLDRISEEIRGDSGITSALLAMGVELHPTKGVVLTDIELSAEVVKARQDVQAATMKVLVAQQWVFEAEQLARGQVKLGEGFIDAVVAIFQKGKEFDDRYTLREATELLLSMRGLTVLETHRGSDLTLVGRGLQDVITSIRIGRDHDESGSPDGQQPIGTRPLPAPTAGKAKRKKGGA